MIPDKHAVRFLASCRVEIQPLSTEMKESFREGIYMFFSTCSNGMCHFVIHIPVVNLDRDLGPLRLTAWPDTHIHTNTHSTHFLPPHPRAYTIHHLPMNLPPSTSTLHFCASLSVTLLLPSISSLPSPRCQVSRVLSYAKTCWGFLILPIWCRCRPFLLSVLVFLHAKQCWPRGCISPQPAVFLTLICPPSCVPL